MGALGAELPAVLMAATEYWNVEHEGLPVRVALVLDTVSTLLPFSKIRYWTAQPAPADTAFHDRLTLLLVWLGEVSPPGAGGITHPPPPPPPQAPRLIQGCPLPADPLWVAGLSPCVQKAAW